MSLFVFCGMFDSGHPYSCTVGGDRIASRVGQKRSIMIRRLLLNGLVVVGCVLGLWLADGLYRYVEGWQPQLQGEAGDVLYADTFGVVNDHWQTYEGRLYAQWGENALRIGINTPRDTAYSATSFVVGDFDLRVRARAVEGSIDNGFGVVFRLQEPIHQCDMPLVVLCDLGRLDTFNIFLRLLFRPEERTPSGYYMFLISSDGYYSLWRAEEGAGGVQARAISTWIESDAIVQGLDVVNEVRVVGVGEQFQFFVNDVVVSLCIPDNPAAESTYFAGECRDGQMYELWEDARFGEGKIGVVAHNPSMHEVGVAIDFEAVIIIQPGEALHEDARG